MRRTFFALTIAVALIARAPVRAAEDLSFTFFGDYLESLRRQTGIPGLSAIIVGANDVLWTRALGSQNVERSIAARTDTPYHIDGLMQLVTSSLVLRCVEEGRLSLDDRVSRFDSASVDAGATLAQILSHTTRSGDSAVFDYRPHRMQPLARAVESCTGDSFRATVAGLLDRLAMVDSVPGIDAPRLTPPDPDIPAADVARYEHVLERLATPYSVDRTGRSLPSQHPSTTLRADGGLVSTADDFARFDLAIKRGVLLQPDTLAAAWRAPLGAGGQALPHGFGWFVQSYNGARIVWQYGIAENAGSSLVVTVLPRGLTLILLANSDGLVKPFVLAAGDLTVSPFGRVFLGTFVR